MLGVFLLPAFTCLRHKCQDLFILHREWNQNPRQLQMKNPLYQRRVEPMMLHHTGQKVQHTTDYSSPRQYYYQASMSIILTNYQLQLYKTVNFVSTTTKHSGAHKHNHTMITIHKFIAHVQSNIYKTASKETEVERSLSSQLLLQ